MPITKLCKIAAQYPPTSLLRCPKDHRIPHHPAKVQIKENRYCLFPCASLRISPLIHFHSVFRTSTLHFNSFATISAPAPRVRYAHSFYEPKIHPHCSVLAYRRRAVDFPTSCNLRKSVFFNLCNLCPISNHKSNIHPFWSSHSLPYLTFPTLSSGLFPFSATSLPHKNNHDLPHHPIKVQSGDK